MHDLVLAIRLGRAQTIPMDWAMHVRHLHEAERHVAQGDRLIERQKEIIAELQRDDHPKAYALAVAVLDAFMRTQEQHVRHLDHLRAEMMQDRLYR
jgi:hypothetical protein